MAITISTPTQIPTNVVEVGNEISADQLAGITSATTPSAGNPFSTASAVTTAISTKADLASAALTGNVTITTNSANPALIIVQDGAGDVVQFKDVAADTTYSFINASGKVNTILSATANAGLNIPHGLAPTSPVNGDIWTTTTGLFVRVNSVTQTMATTASLSVYLTSATAAATYLTPTSANTTYLAKAGGTLTGAVTVTQINNTLNTDLVIDAYNDTGAGTHYLHSFTNTDGRLLLATNGGGLTFPDGTTQITAGYPNTNPNGYVSTSGISQDQAYAIALTSNIASFTWNSFNWGGTIDTETPYFSANKASTFKFFMNNQYEFTPTWSGTAFSLNGISDDTTYTTTGTGESFTVKWNSVNGGVPVI